MVGGVCSQGMRTSVESLVTGAVRLGSSFLFAPSLFFFSRHSTVRHPSSPQVLPIWQFVASAASRREKDKGMRVVRATTDDGVTHVGLHVPRVAEMDRIIGAVQALDGAAGMSDDEEGGG